MLGDEGHVLASLQDRFIPVELQAIMATADQLAVAGEHVLDLRGACLADLLTHAAGITRHINDRECWFHPIIPRTVLAWSRIPRLRTDALHRREGGAPQEKRSLTCERVSFGG